VRRRDEIAARDGLPRRTLSVGNAPSPRPPPIPSRCTVAVPVRGAHRVLRSAWNSSDCQQRIDLVQNLRELIFDSRDRPMRPEKTTDTRLGRLIADPLHPLNVQWGPGLSKKQRRFVQRERLRIRAPNYVQYFRTMVRIPQRVESCDGARAGRQSGNGPVAGGLGPRSRRAHSGLNVDREPTEKLRSCTVFFPKDSTVEYCARQFVRTTRERGAAGTAASPLRCECREDAVSSSLGALRLEGALAAMRPGERVARKQDWRMTVLWFESGRQPRWP